MKRMKIAVLFAALAAFFSPVAQAFFPQVIPMRTLCVHGSPEPLLAKLLEEYNEVPKHFMEISVDSPNAVVMIVTENANNPSSTIVMVNKNLNLSCVFFTAKDVLKDSGAKSLPKKMPEEEGKLNV